MGSINIIWTGTVKDGLLRLDSEEAYSQYIKSLEGRKVRLVVSKFKPPRNTEQNKRHWARMEYAGEILGYTKLELHDVFIDLFLTDRTGKLPKIKRSTSLTTEEFSRWEEQIDQKLSELGIVCPEVEE